MWRKKMEKYRLAQDLRKRQYKAGLIDRRIVEALSDDDIIDSYITCSCCGEKQVQEPQLTAVIARAANTDEFFDLCETVAKLQVLIRDAHHVRRKPKKRSSR
jgi:hypothetical protein